MKIVVFDKIGIIIYGVFIVVRVVMFVEDFVFLFVKLIVIVGVVELSSEYFLVFVIIKYVKEVYY